MPQRITEGSHKTGPLNGGGYPASNFGNPTSDGDLATKKYVDDEVGSIDLTDYATKTYVGEEIGNIPAWDTVAASGDVDMDGNTIAGLAEPEADDEAATKNYVDEAISGIASSMTLIASQTKANSTSNVFTFDSIPQGYTHLKLIVMGRSTKESTEDQMNLTLNNDSGATKYNWQATYTSGGTITSTSPANFAYCFAGSVPAASADAYYVGTAEIDVYDYTQTAFFNNINIAGNNRPIYLISAMGTYGQGVAITRADVTLADGNFLTGSKAQLYGY
jgi:hypothetical protein